MTVSHRVVLAPLSRSRATKDHVQRAGCGVLRTAFFSPGSLFITEAATIHPAAVAWAHSGSIYTDAQVQAWKKVRLVSLIRDHLSDLPPVGRDTIHTNGTYVFIQLWAFGRATNLEVLKADDPSFELVGTSAIPMSPSRPTPVL